MRLLKNILYVTSTVSILAMNSAWASNGLDNDNNRTEAPKNASLLSTHAPDFKALEAQFPLHFKGFSETSIELANIFRTLNKPELLLKPIPELKDFFTNVDAKLEKYGDTFSSIRSDISKCLSKKSAPNPLEYLGLLFRIAFIQKNGTQEEAMYFKGAGFPNPYKLIFKMKDIEEATTAMQGQDADHTEKFLLQLLESNNDDSDSDDELESDVVSRRSYMDPKDLVENEFVEKGPFATRVLPLVGEDVLGFFYLAWAYSQGIHPVPFPLEDNQNELHGISMSPFAKVCHDLAHSEGDLSDHSAEQFADFLISHNLNVLRPLLPLLPLEIRKHFAFKSVLPMYAEFAMDLHNLYHRSLMDILTLSLQDLNPMDETKRHAFEAFSVGAYLQAHEEPQDLSTAYGTPDLEHLLNKSVDLEQKTEQPEAAEQKPDEDAPSTDLKDIGDTLFKTSFVNEGKSPLTDEQIFNIAKGQEKIASNLQDHEITDFEVERNKYFIEVRIHKYNGEVKKFRQLTNYSSLLNIEHDLTVLRAAAPILKSEYKYDIPVAPVFQNFDTEETYSIAVQDCLKQIETGNQHLLDFWLQNAVRLSKMPLGNTTIAENFAECYKAATDELKKKLLPDHVKSALDSFPLLKNLDLQAFIRDAQQPDAVFAYYPQSIFTEPTAHNIFQESK